MAVAQTTFGPQTGTPTVGRPFQGLFGGNTPDPFRDNALDLTLSAAGAYDDNILASGNEGQARPLDPRYLQSGTFGLAHAGLTYSKNSERLMLEANAGAGVRYVPDADNYSATSYRGLLTLNAPIGARTRIGVDTLFRYAPYYRLGLLPNEFDGSFGNGPLGAGRLDDPRFQRRLPYPHSAPAPEIGDVESLGDENLALASQSVYRSAAAASLIRDLSSRSALHFQYSFLRSTYPDSDLLDLTRQMAGVTYLHQLRQDLGYRVGYGYHLADYNRTVDDQPFEAHDLDVGLDFARAISLSRRTTFAFGTGSTVLVRERTIVDDRRLQFRFLGNASLDHQMGQSWSAHVSYRRGWRFIDGLPGPYFSDGVNASIGGYFDRRTDFIAAAGYATGQRSEAGGRAYDTSFATARLQRALTRNLALFIQYLFYHYDFRDELELPPGFLSRLDRQGARVGLNVWIPLLH